MHESTFEFNLGKHRKGYMDCEGCEKIRSKSARLDAVVVSRSRSDQLRKRPLAPNMNESKHVKFTRDMSIYGGSHCLFLHTRSEAGKPGDLSVERGPADVKEILECSFMSLAKALVRDQESGSDGGVWVGFCKQRHPWGT